MSRKHSLTSKPNHQIHTSELSFANSTSLLSEDVDSPIPSTNLVSQSRNQLLTSHHDEDNTEEITIQTNTTNQPNAQQHPQHHRINTKSPIARIFHALSSHNQQHTTTIIEGNVNDRMRREDGDDYEDDDVIILKESNYGDNQRLKHVEWHSFENIIANDILMIIAEFLDDSTTMVNLAHTCAMWYNFLDREQRFWNRLYQIKIQELKLLYFKDFDIYVQEKVVKRRILAVKNYFFNRKKGGNIGQYHLNYLMSNGRKINTKPSLLELGGICKIESTLSSPPKSIEFLEDVESPRERNQEVISIEMDEFSNNSGASQTALIDHQLSEPLTSEEYISEEEEIEILTLINESDCDSEESTVQIPPSMFKKYKSVTIEGVNDILFEKDCFLECLKTEKKVKQYGIDIFRKIEKKKSDRFTTIPLSEQIILDDIEGLSAIHFIFSAPLIYIFFTCFVLGFSIKGVLVNIGVDYENEWSWIIIFLPLYCGMLNILISSIIELRLSSRKLGIALRNNSKRREKQRNIMFLRKMFFDSVMTSLGSLLFSICGTVFVFVWNLYLCLPHSQFSQSPWYLFAVFAGSLTIMLIYCFLWLIVRSIKFRKVISKLTSTCNSIVLLVTYAYCMLCVVIITYQFAIESEIDWAVALIPLFVVEFLLFLGTIFVAFLWCCLECRALYSNSKRYLYINMYITILISLVFLFIHHTIVIVIPEQFSFGFATLFLLPLPLILLPCLSCSIKYIDNSGNYLDLVK